MILDFAAEQLAAHPALSALDLGDTRELRIVREGQKNTVWAFGRVRKLFFVTGHARSGTNWIAALLMRHPSIYVDGEYYFQELKRGFDAFRHEAYHRAIREPVRTVAESCFQDTVRLCIAACSIHHPDAEWVGDRTPRPLEVFLPGAPHFVITRDGRDVLVSLAILEIAVGGPVYQEFAHCPVLRRLREEFLKDKEYFKKNPDRLLTSEPFTQAIAQRWAAQIRHDHDVIEKIHAGDIDASVFSITYEALHEDPERHRARMYQFLGLDPAKALPLTVESETLPGFRGDNHTSDRRKGVVGDWHIYFTDTAKNWFKQAAGTELIRAGYEPSNDW
ncbi:MAG: sulfotransferase [Phycisphaerales bacterium]|nr:sulfotransferase [Phycisphaerales bacterium]